MKIWTMEMSEVVHVIPELLLSLIYPQATIRLDVSCIATGFVTVAEVANTLEFSI
jgi:hypothetical protein